MDEGAGLDAALAGHSSELGFQGILGEGREAGEAVAEGDQVRRQVRVARELGDRLERVVEPIAEVGDHDRGQLPEGADTAAMQLDRRGQTQGIDLGAAARACSRAVTRRRGARGEPHLGEEGPQVRQQLGEGQAREILRAHPGQLLEVEDRRRGVEAIDREQGDHLGPRQDLAVASRAPAEQRQVVVQRLRQDALGAELFHRGGAGALGEALLVGPQDQRQVAKHRHLPAQRLEKWDVLGGVREVVLAADDVGDAHVDIVADHRHVIGRRAVRAQQDEVVEDVRREVHVAAHQVGEADVVVRHAETHGEALAGGDAGGDLRGREAQAGARVKEGHATLLGLGALLGEQLGGAEAAIGRARRQQLLAALAVPGQPLALQERPFVPRRADPGQRRQDLASHRGVRALAIGVLDAQHERAAKALAQQVVVDRGAGAADVEESSRRRGEADPHGA